MKLADVAALSNRLATEPKRTAKIAALASLLEDADSSEIGTVVSYLSGKTPQGRIGLGFATLAKARETRASVEPLLTVLDVDQALTTLASLKGAGSARRRDEILRELFQKATPEEQDFLFRLLTGELRQGALSGVMAQALSEASGVPLPKIRRALMVAADLALVARRVMLEGAAGLSEFSLAPMQPVEPMLAQTAETVEEALARLGRGIFDYKLDGARIQVHKRGSEVRIYSRRLNDITDAIPEVVQTVAGLPETELILDGEVLALRKDGTPESFQVTMRRFGRRLDVERLLVELPLSPFFFDCLYRAGRDLTQSPATERMKALEASVPSHLIVPRIVTADVAEAERFFEQAREAGHEGLMAKALEAPYEAGGRGYAWLKLKRAHTLDLVILAAEWGSGRRRGWLSNLHLGARDPETGEFVMVGKTFKGMTDDMLEWQTARLLELATRKDGYVVQVRPELVVEVAFNDVQRSPRYPGGVALRFARIKGYRADKRPEDADTIGYLKSLAP